MAWQHVGVEAGLGHGAGQHRIHGPRIEPGTGQYFATDLDAQVNGRYLGQCATDVDPRRSHRIKNRHIRE
ncbi:hypothetical protein D3C79_1062430 [compost metagenome]